HSHTPQASFCHVTALKLIAPCTPADCKGRLKSTIPDQKPVSFSEAQLLYAPKGEGAEGEYTIPIGQAEVKQAGNDVTIVAYSKMLLVALEAAAALAREGISAEVIDPRTLKPLDLLPITTSVRKTGRLV